MKFERKRLWFLLFLLILIFAAYSLYYPLWGKLIYPLHYEREIYYYADKFQKDPYLIAAVIHVESGFDSHAISPKGARGLMQIMPETGEWAAMALEIEGYNQGMLFDPQHNIKIGTWYLSFLQDRFDNNLIAALAAYNGGQSRVARWIEEGVWDGVGENIYKIPYAETRDYVNKVLRAYDNYQKMYSS